MVDSFSSILDFPKFSEGGPPDPPPPPTPTPYKRNTSIKSSKSFFNNNSSQRQNKGPEKPSPIKTIYKEFIFRLYRNWKKEEGKIFFVWFETGLFETLICAIAEDKVCDSCIVSSWTLLIILLCLW